MERRLNFNERRTAGDVTAFSPDQYQFIVEKLAEGESHAGIVSDFCRRWKDVPLDIPDIAGFKREKLPPGWRAYFDQHRSEFIENAPTQHKGFRIALLDKKARDTASKDSLEAAEQTRKLLEQIAKEESGFYAGKAPPAAAPTTEQIVAITRTVIDPRQEPEHPDAAGVPAAPAAEPV